MWKEGRAVEQLTDDERRQWKRARARRALTVALAALVSLALAAGAVAGDLTDVIPGPLTLREVAQSEVRTSATVLEGGTITPAADLTRTVDAKRAAALVDALRRAPGVGKDISAAVIDPNGTVVAAHGESTPREPASTLKTLTALAAASVLDMGATFTTQTLFVQQANGADTVILKGDGDMLLGAGESDPHHVNGRSGLATLANETARALEQRGISSITLAYDDTLFGTDRTPPDIAQNNPGNLYYTPVSSMAIDGGRLRATTVDPDRFADYPELSQTTAQDVAARFAALLAEHGIIVTNTTPKAMRAPADRTALAAVHSASLSAVMGFMLQHSDNTLAEEFGRLLALHTHAQNSPQGAIDAVTAELRALGVPTEGLHMADCSGLSPGSHVTVTTLVDVQQRNFTAGGAVAAAEGLSVPGLVGTAVERLAKDDAAGLMRVKTGSLGEVTSMAGNISRIDGGALAFAVIVNNPTDIGKAREAIDTFIAGLAAL